MSKKIKAKEKSVPLAVYKKEGKPLKVIEKDLEKSLTIPVPTEKEI